MCRGNKDMCDVILVIGYIWQAMEKRKERGKRRMKYYIADQHFFHRNMLTRMDNRGFGTLEEMHEYMIMQWNRKVRKNDEIYILGDLSFGNGENTNAILRDLNGKKFLIEGNHDRHYLKDRKFD